MDGLTKRIWGLCLAVFFVLSFSSFAQADTSSVDDIVAKMKTQLELTDKQVDEVKPIIENYLVKEQQLKLEEKKQLSKVLTGQQMYTWNFLQNEAPREKKKR